MSKDAARGRAKGEETARATTDPPVYASPVRISSSSGNRPSACFEKRSRPSTTTSNCPFDPGIGVAWRPSFDVISPARLAARVS
jgi:hypothetical protein